MEPLGTFCLLFCLIGTKRYLLPNKKVEGPFSLSSAFGVAKRKQEHHYGAHVIGVLAGRIRVDQQWPGYNKGHLTIVDLKNSKEVCRSLPSTQNFVSRIFHKKTKTRNE